MSRRRIGRVLSAIAVATMLAGFGLSLWNDDEALIGNLTIGAGGLLYLIWFLTCRPPQPRRELDPGEARVTAVAFLVAIAALALVVLIRGEPEFPGMAVSIPSMISGMLIGVAFAPQDRSTDCYRCVICLYSLRRIEATRCPECGHPIGEPPPRMHLISLVLTSPTRRGCLCVGALIFGLVLLGAKIWQ